MKRHKTYRNRHPLFEPLESRLLLSGDGFVDVDPGPVEANGVVLRMVGIDNDTDAAENVDLHVVNLLAEVMTTPSQRSSDVWDDTDIVHVSAESLPDRMSVNRAANGLRWDDTDIVHVFVESLPNDQVGVNREADGLRCVTEPHHDGMILQVPDMFASASEAANGTLSSWAGVGARATLNIGFGDGKLKLDGVRVNDPAGSSMAVEPAEIPIVIDILGSTEDFEM